MEAIDQLFRSAVQEGKVHGAVLLGQNLKGDVSFAKSYGVRSLANLDPTQRPAMQIDTPMRFASACKFLTSIMVLQCVERGQTSLDDTLEKTLPEIAKQKVAVGFNEETKEVEQREPKSAITLRQLISHSGGLSYAPTSTLLIKLREAQGRQVEQGYATLDENFDFPLVYDPGTDWAYSPGLDWCSRLIARVSGLTPEEYLQRYIAQPLGISDDDMTFHIWDNPSMGARRADMVVRDHERNPVHQDETYWTVAKEPHGGQGIFTTPGAYFKVLMSIFQNDGKLLKPETRNLLFESALSPESERGVNAFVKTFRGLGFGVGAPIPDGLPVSHSVGGMLMMKDSTADNGTPWRRKGSLSWSAVTNVFWNIDPKAGICSLWAFHSKPYCDPIAMELGTKFEQALYKTVLEGHAT